MNKTLIEWVKNPDGSQGYTFNPITGCLNHDKGMCKGGGFPCYAYRLANGRLKYRYLENTRVCVEPFSRNWASAINDPFYPRFWKDKLDIVPNRLKLYTVGERQYFNAGIKPKGVFVCDMSDLFGIGIPEEWTRKVLNEIKKLPQWRFYLLTKQPQNLIKFSPFPDNCWVGVTVAAGRWYIDAFNALREIEASVKYISFEPLLTRIDGGLITSAYAHWLDWVIIGAQTKPTVYPKIEWVEEIVRACDKARIPVFLKDNLKPLLINDKGFAQVSVGTLIEWNI